MLNCPCGLNRGELTENNLVDHNNQKCKALYNLNENVVVCGMLFTAHPPPPGLKWNMILLILIAIGFLLSFKLISAITSADVSSSIWLLNIILLFKSSFIKT